MQILLFSASIWTWAACEMKAGGLRIRGRHSELSPHPVPHRVHAAAAASTAHRTIPARTKSPATLLRLHPTLNNFKHLPLPPHTLAQPTASPNLPTSCIASHSAYPDRQPRHPRQLLHRDPRFTFPPHCTSWPRQPRSTTHLF
ncbi:MAG: hypothetical protein EP343_06295 [Deltaproteobacteria bacterium]|nr:MAG: hypothetical protein EP343_06295 [Deltaproteobacteria bacterium]